MFRCNLPDWEKWKTTTASKFMDAQMAFIAADYSKFRAECLNTLWFMSDDDARPKMEDWRRSYNEESPTAGPA